MSGWDADRYQRQFGFVSAMAGGVLELLDASSGEVVLDLGCGTGELAARIAATGARVIGLDSDPAMVAAAARRLGPANTLLADAHAFRLPEPVDAVFSNAALHWMPRPGEVVACVRAALRPGGRFVAEMGGAGNIAEILAAVGAALAEAGLPEPASPWYFPTPAQQAALLEGAGFRVARMEYFPRPTPLADCPDGLADWLEMFGRSLTAEVPADRRPRVLARVNELAAPRLRRDGEWFADYWRLRFVAVADAPAAGPRRVPAGSSSRSGELLRMKVGLDATPLLGPQTGVGRYVAGLAAALAGLPGPEPEEVALVPFSWRGTADLPRVAATLGGDSGTAGVAPRRAGTEGPAPRPGRLRCGRRRVPARLLQAAWARLPVPPVEWLAGPVDVFHATNFVAPPARRAASVVTVHDLSYLRYPEMVTAASARYERLVPRALGRGATVCTPSAAVAAEVADTYRLPSERLVVTPLGVGPAWRRSVPPDPAWLAAHDLPERYLLFVGSREPRKNLPTLLAAYRSLLGGRVPPAAGAAAGGAEVPPLVLAGPPGWGETLDLAGLPPGAVRTPGYLAEEDLVRLVAGAAALAFPSWYEGFGLPALEALACGTPVVAADLPALREILADQAELVPPGDADALADALLRVLDDPGGEPARAARRARAAGFTWDACARATLAAYDRALGTAR